MLNIPSQRYSYRFPSEVNYEFFKYLFNNSCYMQCNYGNIPSQRYIYRFPSELRVFQIFIY